MRELKSDGNIVKVEGERDTCGSEREREREREREKEREREREREKARERERGGSILSPMSYIIRV